LTLAHELGHLVQTRRGGPAGDQLKGAACDGPGLEGGAYAAALVAYVTSLEVDADAFTLATMRGWAARPGEVSSLGFDPWAFVRLVESLPAGSTYPPTLERVMPFADALVELGVPEPAPGAVRARGLLDRLKGFADKTAAAVERLGGFPPAP
jgi:hypothetical protein